MITSQDASSIRDLVTNAQTIYIALAEHANYDTVASALALYLSFKNAGKNVQVVCSAPMRVEFSYLVGVDEIQTKVGNRNLLVSFAYDPKSVDKVSYHISEDGSRFNLVIAPSDNAKALDPSTVEYSYTGAAADLVFILGASSFDDLGEVFFNEQYFFESAETISIAAFEGQPFARRMYDTAGQTCVAEGVAELLNGLGFEPTDDVATNLLSAIESSTNRFQSMGMAPETFELVAQLMRNGARRSSNNPEIHGQDEVSPNAIPPMMARSHQAVPEDAHPAFQSPIRPMSANVPAARSVSTGSFAEALKKKAAQLKQMKDEKQQVQAYSSEQPYPQQVVPQHQQIRQMQRSNRTIGQQQSQQSQDDQPPADWLQPKMFTGTSKV
jgi:hypothetical protein